MYYAHIPQRQRGVFEYISKLLSLILSLLISLKFEIIVNFH